MSIREDPDGFEIHALLDLVDFRGKQVLEIGSGDGRLTWRYAAQAAHVTGIEPFAPSVDKARARLPAALADRVDFLNVGFDVFAQSAAPGCFDVAILSWAL